MGGLCWCIAASGKAVDANILFQENMPLGKKLRLAENVCKVLIKMKCKAELLPHQIQGLDFGKLFPVIKWLVQQVYDFREEHGDMIRDYSMHHFRKYGDSVADVEHEAAYVHSLSSTYQRQRVLRRPMDMWEGTMKERQMIQTCLLEFGERTGMALSQLGAEEDDESDGADTKRSKRKKKKKGQAGFDRATQRRFADLQKAEKKRMEEEGRMQAENEEKLLQILAGTTDEAESSVRGKDVGRLVSNQGEALKAASEKYTADAEATRKLIESREPHTRRGKAAAFKRRKAALERQIAMKEKMATMMHKRVQMITSRAEAIEKQIAKSRAHNKKVQGAIDKLAALESKSEFKEDLAKLRKFVLLNESLKKQEKTFKASCKSQKAEWETKIEALKSGKQNSSETKRLLEIEEMYAEVSSKYNRGRQLLARKAREIAKLLRNIDEVPLRSELIQYERRFTELDDLLAAKFEEYAKYFKTYNNLNEQRDLYQKEAKLIQQINDIFEAAMKSKNQKESFLTQCANIASLVKKSISKKKAVLETKESQSHTTNTQLQQLVDKQRKYLKLVAKFQAACDLNEKLSEQVPSST